MKNPYTLGREARDRDIPDNLNPYWNAWESKARYAWYDGWSEVYWSLFDPNGYEITSGFGGGTVREMAKELRETADLFLDKFAVSGLGYIP